MQIVQKHAGESSADFASHLESMAVQLSQDHKVSRALALFSRALQIRTSLLQTCPADQDARLGVAQTHRLLADHYSLVDEESLCLAHARKAIALCCITLSEHGVTLKLGVRWTSAQLTACTRSPDPLTCLSRTPARARLPAAGSRAAARVLAASLLTASKVLLWSGSVQAVMYATNASTCASYATGSRSQLAIRAQAHICHCAVSGLAHKQSSIQPPGTPMQTQLIARTCAMASLLDLLQLDRPFLQHLSGWQSTLDISSPRQCGNTRFSMGSTTSWGSDDLGDAGDLSATWQADTLTAEALEACARRLAKCEKALAPIADCAVVTMRCQLDRAHLCYMQVGCCVNFICQFECTCCHKCPCNALAVDIDSSCRL
jgi:hypothetical protein